MKKQSIVICAVALLILAGCVRRPTYPDIPHIEFKSASDTLLHLPNTGTARDSVQFILSFTDGDGDFGVPSNVFDTSCGTCSCLDHSTDARFIANTSRSVFYYSYASGFPDSCIDGISTAYIPVSSRYSALQGEITFSINVECPGSGTRDTLHYSIFIKDRAGHLSNRILSPGIVIDCN